MACSPNSIIDNANNIISQPRPTFLKNNYPTAPTILPSPNISTPSIQLTLRENINVEFSSINTVKCTTVSNHNDILYYYQAPPSYQNGQKNRKDLKELLLLLYDVHKNPIWKLDDRDWHGMTLIHENLQVKLSTSPPLFTFAINEQMYHWQAQPQNSLYSLKCFQTATKLLVAELNNDQLSLYYQSNEYNPFRQLTQIDPYTTLIILTGLLVNLHLKDILQSLGGGPEALQITIDPNKVYINNSSELKATTPGFHHGEEEEEEDDDVASLSYTRNYPGHQSLVYDADPDYTWSSSAPSFKSIELDPGVWHCWWGYTFWWSWFPCCMPGGRCDKARIGFNGHRKPKARTSRTLSKQGWQQQNY